MRERSIQNDMIHKKSLSSVSMEHYVRVKAMIAVLNAESVLLQVQIILI